MRRIEALAVVLAISCSSQPAPRKGGSPFETFTATKPKAGELAPAFDLKDADGAAVKLSDATARGPVVLVFGSFT